MVMAGRRCDAEQKPRLLVVYNKLPETNYEAIDQTQTLKRTQQIANEDRWSARWWECPARTWIGSEVKLEQVSCNITIPLWM